MLAMLLSVPGGPLVATDIPMPQAHGFDLLVKVLGCGVRRTDLHIIDGELPCRRPAIVPGHEVVGRVVAMGSGATRFRIGERVGIPWLGGTCGNCGYCTAGRYNQTISPSSKSCVSKGWRR